jgi:VWFA-related protein
MLTPAALLLLALSVPPAGPAETPPTPSTPPDTQFGDEITVSLISMTVRVVDVRGRPIPDLTPDDFRVTVRGREIPVVAVDWVGSGDPEPALPGTPRDDEGPAPEASEPRPAGRLIVFFVQADLNSTRVSGQLRLRPYTGELLATLHPADRMAVISFDSHLHLRQDFTDDREAVYTAIDRGMLYGDSGLGPARGEISLAPSFDLQDAQGAASPERALEVMAEALQALPGEKIVVYLGWGLGRFGYTGVQMTPAFAPAVRALRRARAAVFVLDVTSADHHSLEVGLEAVASATGGTYAKTNVLPGLSTGLLAQAISGHYILTIDPAIAPEEGGAVEVGLRGRRRSKATVLTRPLSLR